MGRSSLERAIFAKATATAYIYPANGAAGQPTEDSREVGLFWFVNALAANSFLEIPAAYGLPPEGEDAMLEVEGSTRTLALIGGASGTGASTTAVASHKRSRTFRPRSGSKSVILTTGRPTKTGSRIKSIITCRFPSWLKISQIADLLGQAIPTTKIGLPPSDTEISPYFRVQGGMTARILTAATAAATATPAVATSQADANTIGAATKQGRGRKAG